MALLSLSASTFAASPLRIATYNINYANRDLDAVVRTILESKADIVALQETVPASEAFLKRTLRSHFPHTRFQGYRGAYGAERYGFLSKYPFAKVEFLPPQSGLFGTLLGTFQTTGGQVQIANVHLTPVRLVPGEGLVTQMKAWSDSDEIRRKEIEQIFGALNKDLPTIIAGDFNSFSTGLVPSFLRSKNFVDSFASVTTNADMHATWTLNSNPAPLSFRLDYIFHNPSSKTLKSQIFTNKSSDHFLVVSEIVLRAPPRPQ